MLDDNEPISQPRHLPPVALDTMGVDELQGYIANLREEIRRVEAAIAAKRNHRGIADSFFRK